jgi:hypothetical protein
MYKKIYEKEKLIEMALVGVINNLQVQVYTDYNPPHFHLLKKDEYEARILIKGQKIIDYKFQKNNKEVSSDEFKKLKSWLCNKNKKEKKISNLDAVIFSWNLLNSDKEI